MLPVFKISPERKLIGKRGRMKIPVIFIPQIVLQFELPGRE
jgi:hypothetical protein